MTEEQKPNKDRIVNALDAFRDGTPSAIVDAVSALTDTEKMIVKLVQELSVPVPKSRATRSDAGKPRVKKAAGPQSIAS